MQYFFTFEKFLAPVLIKISYWIGLVFIVLGTIGGMVGVSYLGAYGGQGSSFGGAFVSLLLGIVAVIVWRVWCEIWLVIFSINDRLGTMATQAPKT